MQAQRKKKDINPEIDRFIGRGVPAEVAEVRFEWRLNNTSGAMLKLLARTPPASEIKMTV